LTNLTFYVCMVSDTLLIDPSMDKTYPFIEEFFTRKGIKFVYTVIPNNKYEILKHVISNVNNYDVILLLGGTGISEHDITVDAIKPLIEKELQGFGEHLRNISYNEIGAKGLMSRALAGKIGSSLIFVVPGNPSALKLVLENIILPISRHALEISYGISGWGKVISLVVERIDFKTFSSFLTRIWREKKSATGIFIGKVKLQVNDRKIKYMLNEISERDLKELSEKISEKYKVNVITIAARGRLSPGEPIFLTGILAEDRKTMNKALTEIIEIFKQKSKHIDYFVS